MKRSVVHTLDSSGCRIWINHAPFGVIYPYPTTRPFGLRVSKAMLQSVATHRRRPDAREPSNAPLNVHSLGRNNVFIIPIAEYLHIRYKESMKLLSTAQVSDVLGVSERRVRALITERKLSAHKIGRFYAIEERVLRSVQVYGQPGRPSKSQRNLRRKK